MIRLRLKRYNGTTDKPDALQWMCPFNIEVIAQGQRAGELVIIPARPGMVINWKDVPVEVVTAGDLEDFALRMPVPEVKKEIIIAKPGDMPVLDSGGK